MCISGLTSMTNSMLLPACSALVPSAVGLLEPRNLRVSDEWYTRFRVAWDPVAAPVLGYKLVYQPTGELSHKNVL